MSNSGADGGVVVDESAGIVAGAGVPMEEDRESKEDGEQLVLAKKKPHEIRVEVQESARQCESLLLHTIASAHQILATLKHLSSKDLPKVNYQHLRADLEVRKAREEERIKREDARERAKKIERARKVEEEMLRRHNERNENEQKWECGYNNCNTIQDSTKAVCQTCKNLREKHERKFLRAPPEVYDGREPFWKCNECQQEMPAGFDTCLIHRQQKRPPGTIAPCQPNVPITRLFFEQVSSQLKQDMKTRVQLLRRYKHEYSNRQHRLGEALKALDRIRLSDAATDQHTAQAAQHEHPLEQRSSGEVAAETAVLKKEKAALQQELMLQNDVLQGLIHRIRALQRDVAMCSSNVGE